MKKLFSFYIALFLTLNAFSQIKFEKGYFIDDLGNKVECLLKNNSIQGSTETIKYKLNQDSEIKTLNLNQVKEFSIYNSYKFIKATVEIGKPSPQNERNKDYTFKSEVVLLKVLVEGEAVLYSHNEKDHETFFFSTNNSAPQQLIYKIYIPENFKTKRENKAYGEQLFNNLKCSSLNFDDAINLKYEKNELIKFFVKYNECQNSETTIYLKKQKIFNINLRPRINNTSLTLTETGNQSYLKTYDFGNKTIIGIGIEAELLFPFLNNKWTLSLEPTYQRYKSNITTQTVGSLSETFNVNYNSLEMPITVRHYSYINTTSSIFLNASLILDFTSKSYILKQLNDILLEELVIAPDLNLAVGVGYKFKNKYIVELRFHSKRNIVNQLIHYTSSYNSSSLIFGYTLF
ncbi:hypothetical protein [Mariniflexile sp.]|uniref:hypothetical protein n=1 Tax=Mariniflexile sp. TaxID=1979402 RepID=UPI00356A3817